MKLQDVLFLFTEEDRRSKLKERKRLEQKLHMKPEPERVQQFYKITETDEYKKDYDWVQNLLMNNPNLKKNLFDDLERSMSALRTKGYIAGHELNHGLIDSHLLNSSSDWILLWKKVDHEVVLYRFGTHARLHRDMSR